MNDPQAEGHMASHIGRRKILATLGGAAAWPLAAGAQQAGMPVGGVLRPSAKDAGTFVGPFPRYMKAIGWQEGRNIRFLFAWMEGRNERAPLLAGDFVAQNVDLIVTFGDPAIRAVQPATQTVPIVGMTDDMVGSGLVASLARPGGNTTGVSILAPELNLKRLEFLHEFVPQARRIAVLADPRTISPHAQLTGAARDLGVELVIVEVQNPTEIGGPLDAIATSSARASTAAGTSRPNPFAVLRLITSSYLVGAQVHLCRQVGEIVFLLSRHPVFADEPGLLAWQMLLALVPNSLWWSIRYAHTDGGETSLELSLRASAPTDVLPCGVGQHVFVRHR